MRKDISIKEVASFMQKQRHYFTIFGIRPTVFSLVQCEDFKS